MLEHISSIKVKRERKRKRVRERDYRRLQYLGPEVGCWQLNCFGALFSGRIFLAYLLSFPTTPAAVSSISSSLPLLHISPCPHPSPFFFQSCTVLTYLLQSLSPSLSLLYMDLYITLYRSRGCQIYFISLSMFLSLLSLFVCIFILLFVCMSLCVSVSLSHLSLNVSPFPLSLFLHISTPCLYLIL